VPDRRLTRPRPPPLRPSLLCLLRPLAATTRDSDLNARRREILELHAELRNRNHFDILGVPRASTEVQVKEAYFRMAKRFHPDVQHEAALQDLKDKLESIFIRLGEAYEVLRNPRSRANYEADLNARAPRPVAATGPAVTPGPSSPLAPPPEPPPDPQAELRMAEESVRKAEKRFREEQYWDAIQLLEPAIPKLEGRPRSRARVLLARCYTKNPHWMKRAEEVLQNVVQEDPKLADAYYVLGTIYRAGGLKSRAVSMLRKTVELKPDHEDAARELSEIAPGPEETASTPPETEGGGFLKKLFGRS
jgi:tetratricopeptide (TPR) repeat protein